MKRTAIIVTVGVIVSLAVYQQMTHLKSVSSTLEHRKASGRVSSSMTAGNTSQVTSIVQVATNQLQAVPTSSAIITEKPTRLRIIFGLPGETYAQRLKAIQSLTPPLTAEEVKAAFEFLHSKGGSDVNLEHVLKNNVMNLLREQNAANYVRELCGLYHDRSQDDVTRDYAIQHLVSGYLEYPERYASDRPELHDALWEATQETDTSIAGTALLGLSRLQSTDPGIDSNRVNELALKLANDPACGQLTRITAIQICAESRLPDVLPVATQLALQGASISIRASAIAAIGAVGGSQEVNVLKELAQKDEPALRPAVEAALKRLSGRIGKSSNG